MLGGGFAQPPLCAVGSSGDLSYFESEESDLAELADVRFRPIADITGGHHTFRMILSRRPRPIFFVLLGGLILFGLLLCWFFGLGTPTGRNLPRPFQSNVWKTSDGFKTKARCSMVADLRNRIGLVGRSRAELVALIGPDDTREIYPEEKSSLLEPTTYVLCEDFPDYIVLTIEWRNGRVSQTYVGQT